MIHYHLLRCLLALFIFPLNLLFGRIFKRFFFYRKTSDKRAKKSAIFGRPSRELIERTKASVRGWRFLEGREALEYLKKKDTCGLFGNFEESCGKQAWIYDPTHENVKFESFDASVNPNAADQLLRQQLTSGRPHFSYEEDEGGASDDKYTHWRKGISFGVHYLLNLQTETGCWVGDYGGPHFLIPSLTISLYSTGQKISPQLAEGFVCYLKNHQQEDGGWGIHIEGYSQVYTTCLSYVALRILGCSRDDPCILKASEFMKKNGGITETLLWAKVLFATLGLMDWRGVPPVLPDFLCLPSWVPVLPANMWCHSRVVYVPMAYLYGHKWTMPVITPLLKELREELYTEKYENINWSLVRRMTCAQLDAFIKTSAIARFFMILSGLYEDYFVGLEPFKSWRKRSLDYAYSIICYEDEITQYLNLGPVNKVFNIIARHRGEADSKAVRKHLLRLADYVWVAEDGVKIQGEPGGGVTWETSFAASAVVSAKQAVSFNVDEALLKAFCFLEKNQMLVKAEDRSYYWRSRVSGGWGFTLGSQNWPVSDTTSEALMALLLVESSVDEKLSVLSKSRLYSAVDFVLSLQNYNGGWGTYEKAAVGSWFEAFNMLEVFDKVMIDYPCTECSASCVSALVDFSEKHPDYRREAIEVAVLKGRRFILQQQEESGGWYGSWAVCFTYGTWHAIKAIKKSEKFISANSSASKLQDKLNLCKACQFLVDIQRFDGGWREAFGSCIAKGYIPPAGKIESDATQTAWAVLALVESHVYDNTFKEAIKRGVSFILKMQLKDGNWPQQGILGQFNSTVGITYSNYRNIFPLWALSEAFRARHEIFSE